MIETLACHPLGMSSGAKEAFISTPVGPVNAVNDQTAQKRVTGIFDQFGWEAAQKGKVEATRAIEPF